MATEKYIQSGLAHFKNSTAAVNNWEPVYQNQFEVMFQLPSYCNGSEQLLLEQVIYVDGLPEITPTGTVSQRYKFAERVYADAGPNTTLAHLTIQFEVNLSDNNDMYVYNSLRQWANIQYNPTYGSQGLKSNYVGALTICEANKAQEVHRKWEFHSVIMDGAMTAQKLVYHAPQDIYRLTAKFVSDWWDEKRTYAYDESDLLV